MATTCTRADLEEIFKLANKDGDCKLDVEELSSLFADKLPKEDCEKILAAMNTDGKDGVSCKEFCDALEEFQKSQAQ